jgi:hypothetical protein
MHPACALHNLRLKADPGQDCRHSPAPSCYGPVLQRTHLELAAAADALAICRPLLHCQVQTGGAAPSAGSQPLL